MSLPFIIAADEINRLIYSYLQDSGFTHTSFTFRVEAHLDYAPNFNKSIPRGELIELLTKALFYKETESHWKGDTVIANCKRPFTLLGPHECFFDPPPFPKPVASKPSLPKKSLPPQDKAAPSTSPANEVLKRKADIAPNPGIPPEKRSRRVSEEMITDEGPLASGGKLSAGHAQPRHPEPPPQIPARESKVQGPSQPSVKRGDSPELSAGTVPRADKVKGKRESLDTDPTAIRQLKAHKSEVFVCAWNPASPEKLATGYRSRDGKVYIWDFTPRDPPTLPQLLEVAISSGGREDLTCLEWNPTGSLLAIGSYASLLRIVNVNGGLYFQHPQHLGTIFTTRFSKSGRWLLTASLDGTACVWDVRAKKLHMQYRCHEECCLDVDWIDESMFASCGADHIIQIMRLNEEKPIRTLIGHKHEINQIRCNAARTRLASCSDDQTARVWRIAQEAPAAATAATSKSVVVLRGHTMSINTVSWGPPDDDGNEILGTCSFDGSSRLWNPVSGECLKVFSDGTKALYVSAFSPRGQWFVTGSGDGWLHIYDVKARRKRWSWFCDREKASIFEVTWQQHPGLDRLALALECGDVVVVDVGRVAALQTKALPPI